MSDPSCLISIDLYLSCHLTWRTWMSCIFHSLSWPQSLFSIDPTAYLCITRSAHHMNCESISLIKSQITQLIFDRHEKPTKEWRQCTVYICTLQKTLHTLFSSHFHWQVAYIDPFSFRFLPTHHPSIGGQVMRAESSQTATMILAARPLERRILE